ncbi:MAG: quinone-dependent dihydroorotate dehydrogenase [Patescibacteria group bacterium]
MKFIYRLFKKAIFLKSWLIYRAIIRPILFRFDSEKIHGILTGFGERIGKNAVLRRILRVTWKITSPELVQNIHGIHFENPVGLAAGFDYEARLTGILPSIGFGFGSVGTITNRPYEGNPTPRLGRLIKSRSLMVNKGLKNEGIHKTLEHLTGKQFGIPIGLSIGKTNSRETTSQHDAIEDIISAFREAEHSPTPFAYYELNISCPNLYGNVEFYSPEHLGELLAAVGSLALKKPLFIKMPIEKSEHEVIAMLDVITSHRVQGIIIGNLQKNRQDPSLDPAELARYPRGNFSGKPTEQKSNELIRAAYRQCGKKLTIVGCGGIFSAEDAYRKIRLGASLVQLITGLIFEGPQLPGKINLGLMHLLQRDDARHIGDVVGMDA